MSELLCSLSHLRFSVLSFLLSPFSWLLSPLSQQQQLLLSKILKNTGNQLGCLFSLELQICFLYLSVHFYFLLSVSSCLFLFLCCIFASTSHADLCSLLFCFFNFMLAGVVCLCSGCWVFSSRNSFFQHKIFFL